MTRATRMPRGTQRGRLMLSLSPAERADLEAAATAAGLPLAAWIRDAALATARPKAHAQRIAESLARGYPPHHVREAVCSLRATSPGHYRAHDVATVLGYLDPGQELRVAEEEREEVARPGAISVEMPMRKERDE